MLDSSILFKKNIGTYCEYSTFTDAADASAILRKAVVDRTIVARSLVGRETELYALSTILTWIVWPGLQVPWTAALMHLSHQTQLLK